MVATLHAGGDDDGARAMTRRGTVLFVLLGLLWGLPYLLIRVAVVQFTPEQVVLVRTAVGAAVLLPFTLRRRLRLSWAQLGWIAIFAAVDVAGPYLLISRAEQQQTSSTTVLIVALTPTVTALLDRGRRLAARHWAGLALGGAGVALVVSSGLAGVSLGSAVSTVLAAVGYAVGALVAARRLRGLPGTATAALALAMTALLFSPAAIHCTACLRVSRASLALLALGVLCTGIALATVFALITEIGPSRTALITYVNPPVATILGVLVLSEPVTPGLVLGLPLILLGAALAGQDSWPWPTRRTADETGD